MSTEENKDLVRRLFDAVNRRALEELDTLLGPDFLLNGEPVGLEDFKEFVDWHASVLTEVRFTIEDLIAEADKVVARLGPGQSGGVCYHELRRITPFFIRTCQKPNTGEVPLNGVLGSCEDPSMA